MPRPNMRRGKTFLGFGDNILSCSEEVCALSSRLSCRYIYSRSNRDEGNTCLALMKQFVTVVGPSMPTSMDKRRQANADSGAIN